MSAQAVGYVWAHSPYVGAQLLIHLAIADVVNDAHGNEFWMSVSELARKTRVHPATVFRALAHMCEDGSLDLLESGKADGVPSRYRFLVDNKRGVSHGAIPPIASRNRGVSHGAIQNSRTTNTRTTSGSFPQAVDNPVDKRPAGGRFKGELEQRVRCVDCGNLDVDCQCHPSQEGDS